MSSTVAVSLAILHTSLYDQLTSSLRSSSTGTLQLSELAVRWATHGSPCFHTPAIAPSKYSVNGGRDEKRLLPEIKFEDTPKKASLRGTTARVYTILNDVNFGCRGLLGELSLLL
jgi:hypothetical protein